MSNTKSLSAVFRAGIAPIFSKAAPSGSRQVNSGSGFWGLVRESFPGSWQRGVAVDPIGALTSFGAVFACVSRIASDIGKLSLQVKEKSLSGVWQVADGAALDAPNTFQTWQQFLVYWLVSKLLYGNAYSVKIRDERGRVVALYPLDPRRVTPMVTPAGDVYYSLGGDDLARVPAGMVVPAREVIHDRGVTLWHPLVGVSPIVACAASATQGNRIQSNSAVFFENMSRPSGMLTAPSTIDEVTAARLKKEWEGNYGGLNLGRLAVLGDGLTYLPMTIPASDAQLVEQLKWTVEDVARCFALPLYKINAGPAPAAASVGQLHTQYYTDALHPYVEAIEQTMDRGFDLNGSRRRHEFDLSDLYRLDGMTQVEMLAKAVGGAIMAPNEARARLDLEPKAGGDSIYLQEQNYSLEALARRDAQADPFTSKSARPFIGHLPAGVDLENFKGEDGRDGRDGEPGRDAVHVEVLDGIDTAKRYTRGTFAHYRGGIVRAFRATDPLPEDGVLEKAGWHVVVRGLASTSLQIGEDLRTVTVTQALTDGQVVQQSVAMPVVIHRGIWREGELYAKGDATTRDGSTWILMQGEERGPPGSDDSGWMLSTKRGRDGRDGLKGDKGDRGAEGRAGRDLTQMGPTGAKW